MLDSIQEVVLNASMCEGYVKSAQVARPLGRSSFGDSLVHIVDSASNNIQEVISLGSALMFNTSLYVVGGYILIFLWGIY